MCFYIIFVTNLLYFPQPIKSKVYQKQCTTFQSHMVNATAVQPLLRILQEDTRALRAKLLSLRNTTAKGFKNHRLSLDRVSKIVHINLHAVTGVKGVMVDSHCTLQAGYKQGTMHIHLMDYCGVLL